MMGQQCRSESLFYSFRIEDHVPERARIPVSWIRSTPRIPRRVGVGIAQAVERAFFQVAEGAADGEFRIHIDSFHYAGFGIDRATIITGLYNAGAAAVTCGAVLQIGPSANANPRCLRPELWARC